MKLVQLRFIKLFTNIRFWIAIIFLVVSLGPIVNGLGELVSDLGVKINGFILPFYLSSYQLSTIYGIVIVLLFCDAPFTEENEIFIITRANRKRWFISRIAYIFLVSVLLILVFFIMLLIELFPNFVLSFNNWGDLLEQLLNTEIRKNYEIYIPVSQSIMNNYSPIQAMLYSCSLFILVSTFIGSVIFFINLYTNRILGSLVGIFFIFQAYFGKFGTINTTNITPYLWIDIGNFSNVSYNYLPTMEYAFAVLMILNISLWIVTYNKFMKNDINTVESIWLLKEEF